MFQLLAVRSTGLEAVVAGEIQELGYETNVENGHIFFGGNASAIVKTDLWLCTADRTKIVAGRLNAATLDELFEQTKVFPWESIIDKEGDFPVQGRDVKSTLHGASDYQAITKRAIVERPRRTYNEKGWLNESGAKYPVEVAILKDNVLLTIGTSGSGSNRRGYRLAQDEAPIREALATSLIHLANWKGDTPSIGLSCGPEVIAIETCLIAQNIASGFNRESVSEQQNVISVNICDDHRGETDKMVDHDEETGVYASDIDPETVEIIRRGTKEVGLSDIIKFSVRDIDTPATDTEEPVALIGNPPYSERIGDREEVEEMYRCIGKLMKQHPFLSAYTLTGNKEFEYLVDRRATRRRKLFNGHIERTRCQYWGRETGRKTIEN